MKIAIVSPIMIEVPPRTYGGVQLMVYELAISMANRGHSITLFCAANSKLNHKNIEVVISSPYPTIDRPDENRYWEAHQLASVLSRQNEFDVIHLFYEPIVCGFLLDGKVVDFLPLFSRPTIASFSNSTNIPAHIDYYKKNRKNLDHITKVFLSKKHRSHLQFLKSSLVIYNGLDLSKYKIIGQKDDYLLFLGRITKEKGIEEAIAVAKQTDHRLIIAAKICMDDQVYYENKIKPMIDGKKICYVGEVDFTTKISYLSRAKAMLFPIGWEEPFGLVVTESLACGTPVLSFDHGSMPEIIKNGYNGYIAKDVKQMIGHVGLIDKIDPDNCRRSVRQKFTQNRMANEYEKLYLKLAK